MLAHWDRPVVDVHEASLWFGFIEHLCSARIEGEHVAEFWIGIWCRDYTELDHTGVVSCTPSPRDQAASCAVARRPKARPGNL